VVAGCACGNIRRASRAISRFYETSMASTHLTATQFSLLAAVHLHGPLPLSRLAEALVLDRTSLYRALEPLERRGDLQVAPGRDRREKAVALADRGRRRLAGALPLWQAAQRRFLAAVGEKHWPAMLSGFGKAVSAVRAAESEDAPAATGSRPDRSRPERRTR
jgi:DNA-binding MarR family transcriptional regulator